MGYGFGAARKNGSKAPFLSSEKFSKGMVAAFKRAGVPCPTQVQLSAVFKSAGGNRGHISLEKFVRFFSNPQKEGVSISPTAFSNGASTRVPDVAVESSVAAAIQRLLRNKSHLIKAFSSAIRRRTHSLRRQRRGPREDVI